MPGYEVIDLIVRFFYGIFGNPYITACFLLGGLLIILAMVRAPLSVILMVLIPLCVGFILNLAYTNFIDIPVYLIIVLFIVMAFLVFMFWNFFQR